MNQHDSGNPIPEPVTGDPIPEPVTGDQILVAVTRAMEALKRDDHPWNGYPRSSD